MAYNVDMDDFLQTELELAEIIKEITTGKGYVILPQLFSPQDIEHARNTTLYLIRTQGEKATHFQVSLDDLVILFWQTFILYI